MPRTRGTGLGTGMALGTAAVIREKNGIPIPPQVPERIALQFALRRGSETPEIVLIAREYSTALALASTISWAKVAAIAAETAPTDPIVPPFPAVVNVSGLLASVEDDVLILVDAGNNFVFPDPDPMFLAQYTAEHDRVAPKRRIYLDEGHYTARTIDGKEIPVFALIEDPAEDVPLAMDQGADGLFLAFNSRIHRAAEAAQRKLTFEMLHAAAGKPLIIADAYTLPSMLICEASVEADITLAEPISVDPAAPGLAAVHADLERTENACFDEDIPASVPRLAALVVSVSSNELESAAVSGWVEDAAAAGATRVVFSLDDDSLSEGVLLELEAYLAACIRCTVPTYVYAGRRNFNLFGQSSLDNSLETALSLLVGAGANGIIVPPDNVQDSKRAISEFDSETCRELYRGVIAAAQG